MDINNIQKFCTTDDTKFLSLLSDTTKTLFLKTAYLCIDKNTGNKKRAQIVINTLEDKFSNLPDDIIFEILLKMDVLELHNMALSSRKVSEINRDENFWKLKYTNEYGNPTKKIKNWKYAYIVKKYGKVPEFFELLSAFEHFTIYMKESGKKLSKTQLEKLWKKLEKNGSIDEVDETYQYFIDKYNSDLEDRDYYITSNIRLQKALEDKNTNHVDNIGMQPMIISAIQTMRSRVGVSVSHIQYWIIANYPKTGPDLDKYLYINIADMVKNGDLVITHPHLMIKLSDKLKSDLKKKK